MVILWSVVIVFMWNVMTLNSWNEPIMIYQINQKEVSKTLWIQYTIIVWDTTIKIQYNKHQHLKIYKDNYFVQMNW